MRINFYHHLGAETIAALQNTGNSELTIRLKKIEELLKIMSNQEKELGEKLAEFQEEQRASNVRIEAIVQALKDKAESEKVDLSDEIALVESLTKTERESFPATSELPTEPQPPVEEVPA